MFLIYFLWKSRGFDIGVINLLNCESFTYSFMTRLNKNLISAERKIATTWPSKIYDISHRSAFYSIFSVIKSCLNQLTFVLNNRSMIFNIVLDLFPRHSRLFTNIIIQGAKHWETFYLCGIPNGDMNMYNYRWLYV